MPASGYVPQDMWVCCSCQGGNLIATAQSACPVCGHWRDSSCLGPGQAYTYSTHVSYEHSMCDAHHAYTEAPKSTTHYYTAAPTLCGYEVSQDTSAHSDQQQQDYNDIWICSECGAENLDWIDLCPMCNIGTKSAVLGYNSAMPATQPSGYATYAPGTYRAPNADPLDDCAEYAGVTGSCVMYGFERYE